PVAQRPAGAAGGRDPRRGPCADGTAARCGPRRAARFPRSAGRGYTAGIEARRQRPRRRVGRAPDPHRRNPMQTTQRAPARSFAEFYAYYLGEHRNPNCRRLHFFGCLGALFCLAKLVATLNPLWLPAALLWGYGLSWIGH